MITNNTAIAIAFIILIIFYFFRKEIANYHLMYQNKHFGFNFGEKSKKIYEKLLVIMALLFFIFTLLVKYGDFIIKKLTGK